MDLLRRNKVWRSITAAQVLNHEHSSVHLRTIPVFRTPACLLDWMVIRTDWRVSKTSVNLQAGGLSEAKAKNLLRVEGKDYVVRDGDVLNIRFSV